MNNKSIVLKIKESIAKNPLRELIQHELGLNSSFEFGNLEYMIMEITDSKIKLSISNNNEYFLYGNYETPVKEFVVNRDESITIANIMKPQVSFEITVIDIKNEEPKVFL